MIIDDTTLAAYLDGELDSDARVELEAVLATDPALREWLERERTLTQRLRAAFDDVLHEPPPARLIAAAKGHAAPGMRLRARRWPRSSASPAWSWSRWGALAASLAIGVLVGYGAPYMTGAGHSADEAPLMARGTLATALSRQLASAAPAQPGAPRIGLTFRNHANQYCRTFTVTGYAGLACAHGREWRIEALAQAPATSGEFRMAASALPASVLQAVDANIDGAPLDAPAEQAARDSGWRR